VRAPRLQKREKEEKSREDGEREALGAGLPPGRLGWKRKTGVGAPRLQKRKIKEAKE
jgi:hypothetical protein